MGEEYQCHKTNACIRLSFYQSEIPYQYGRFLFQGVIPLGGCMVEETMSGSQKFAIRITNQNFKVWPQYLWTWGLPHSQALLQPSSLLVKMTPYTFTLQTVIRLGDEGALNPAIFRYKCENEVKTRSSTACSWSNEQIEVGCVELWPHDDVH